MHICPQEIIAFMTAYDFLKPYVGFVCVWCEQCLDGTHKNCEDHKQSSTKESEDCQNKDI
jgi:hypothetical protein